MQNNSTLIVKDLVLIGGGHSHVTVLKKFGMKPLPGVRLTLICKDIMTPYSGMLPGLIAGHYTFEETHIDLGPLARFAGARFYNDIAIGLDLAEQRILCRNRPPVPFDVVSIDIGSAPMTVDVPGAAEYTVPVKPIDRFVAHWEALRARVLARSERTRIGVVGGGAGGVEVLLAIQYRLQKELAATGRDVDHLEYHLFTDTDEILPTHNQKVRAKFRRVLSERGVQVHTGHRVARVEPGRVETDNGARQDLDEILWVTWAGAAGWVAKTGLDVDERGFIRVNDFLQSTSHPTVFAAGDIATMINHPRPKAGVFAVRQGPPLTENLRRALLNRSLKPFTPQQQFLSLVSTGNQYAVASRSKWAFEGARVWHWKNWIDQRFMDKFRDLPEMAEKHAADLPNGLADQQAIKEISTLAMRCGGCGAKVGSTLLNRALSRLEPVARDDVLVGLHAPDDAAVVEVPPGQVMVHTVDFFRAIVDDPYLFGKIATNHSLGDIFAMGAEPQTALAIATLPYGLEAKVEDTLTQLLSGAMEVLAEAGTALVGGHTGEGAELALGFAVNGLVARDHILRKGGMQPGDRLILTKPLGTGTLFAADMRHKAKGTWIQGALQSMLQSNQAGARCLHRYQATACTDVTGFGLLGHLVEMIKPAGVDVELDLNAIPLLEGALDTAAAGITSSLQPQNVRLRRAIHDLESVASDPRYPLLFDPQTAGGLLASVPGEKAESCVTALREAGYEQTTIIGKVLAQDGRPEPVSVVR
ncbi:MAG: selenide, water dikinase SelD [Candidatus Competibacteraceae bacterium]|nr:selenide, water dikinase SelD [Candidatus Competibacteraceae bacterium]